MPNTDKSNVKAFEEAMAGMRMDYVSSLPDKLDNIESNALRIAKSEFPIEEINELFRDVHSLKGSAGTFELPIISTICHQLEDHLEQFSDKTVEICLQFVDLMRSAVDVVTTSDNPNFNEIERKLYEYQKKISDNQLLGVVIDPSRTNTNLIKGILEQYPIKLSFMNDGLVALTRLLFVKYDFIIASRELPSISGPGMIAALQATNCPNRDTQSIIVSSSTIQMEKINISKIHTIARNQEFIAALPNKLENLFPEITV